MELNYCKVCKLHCEHGKKHKYSAKHVALFNSLVKKFGSKVKECKKYLDFPEVISGEFEPSASFWCHFCEMKIPKHVTNRTFSIKFGGVFEHFASSAHTKKTHNFWKLNGGDTNLKKDFLISEEDYVTYKGRCKKALDNFAQEEDLSHMQAAEEIRSREAERLKIVSDQKHPSSSSSCEGRTVLNSHGVMQNHTGWHDGKRVWRGGIVKQGFRRRDLTKVSKGRKFGEEDSEHIHRTSSFLPTLSSVTPSKNAGKLVGNIHTGAVPPWLQDDDSNQPSSEPAIGPSYQEFLRHAEKKQKKKSNFKSVGANFDHSAETSDDWLPSFGRVWNSGPRWQSRREYRKEKQKTKKEML
ncbi:centrosomal AT-AC splicing factor-like isoform X2 [Rhopilema esculentum]|uniref:centrosomal AT-AC splicing factor-like isoform X2 n=1 Tax=Rhopilema esculentum TaxID=499914 RepID=UPI0031D4E669